VNRLPVEPLRHPDSVAPDAADPVVQTYAPASFGAVLPM
jgi:hypothetical protein